MNTLHMHVETMSNKRKLGICFSNPGISSDNTATEPIHMLRQISCIKGHIRPSSGVK
jgi:hypothetical protein